MPAGQRGILDPIKIDQAIFPRAVFAADHRRSISWTIRFMSGRYLRAANSGVIDVEKKSDSDNADPKPFIWTKSAGQILEKVVRAKQALESQHQHGGDGECGVGLAERRDEKPAMRAQPRSGEVVTLDACRSARDATPPTG
jgi:hypothetical protein